MDVYTVSLFGHREITDYRELENQLTEIVRKLIQTKEYVSFLIGRNGEFDEYGASIIKRARKGLDMERSDLTLVLPYIVSGLEYYEKYYDNVLIPDTLYRVHPKRAITLRNRWMVENSELIIVHQRRSFGGAYEAKKYAEELGKKVITI